MSDNTREKKEELWERWKEIHKYNKGEFNTNTSNAKELAIHCVDFLDDIDHLRKENETFRQNAYVLEDRILELRKALEGNIKRAKRGIAETRGHKCRAVLMLDAIVQSSEQALKENAKNENDE